MPAICVHTSKTCTCVALFNNNFFFFTCTKMETKTNSIKRNVFLHRSEFLSVIYHRKCYKTLQFPRKVNWACGGISTVLIKIKAAARETWAETNVVKQLLSSEKLNNGRRTRLWWVVHWLRKKLFWDSNSSFCCYFENTCLSVLVSSKCFLFFFSFATYFYCCTWHPHFVNILSK